MTIPKNQPKAQPEAADSNFVSLAAGQEYWINRLNENVGSQEVIGQIIESQEKRRQFIVCFHEEFFDRDSVSEELAAAQDPLNDGRINLGSLAKQFLSSEEYFGLSHVRVRLNTLGQRI